MSSVSVLHTVTFYRFSQCDKVCMTVDFLRFLSDMTNSVFFVIITPKENKKRLLLITAIA